MKSRPSVLRDFTVDHRIWLLSAVALVIGTGGAALAVLLLRAIAFFTNLFYYHRFSLAMVGPAGSPTRYGMVLVPIVGGIIVGIMARYGSDKIRGHGIPEAIEAILLHGARVEPRVAVLKPISAAIAIGSGGPFGAEGPIIMTGGAFGSLLAQWVKLTDAERTTLLVAGAAAGMSATFAAPSPLSCSRSSCCSSSGVRAPWFLSPSPASPPVCFASVARRWTALSRDLSPKRSPTVARFTLLAAPLGVFVGLAAAAIEPHDVRLRRLFGKLARVALDRCGGRQSAALGVGVGGLFFPRGLGVGYDNIAELLAGHATLALIFGVIVSKSLMWAFSLGSGTSGGVLAPLLMIGASLGALSAHMLHMPGRQPLALLGMGAMLAGALGLPLTAIVFSLELTHASAGAAAAGRSPASPLTPSPRSSCRAPSLLKSSLAAAITHARIRRRSARNNHCRRSDVRPASRVRASSGRHKPASRNLRLLRRNLPRRRRRDGDDWSFRHACGRSRN